MPELFKKNLLSTQDLNSSQIQEVLATAKKMLPYARKEKTSKILEGKVLAALFYEPSTRTRLSFETAMLRLGGEVISAVGMETSSLVKGETLADTGKVVENFADIIAMRHPQPGSVRELSTNCKIPVINAGDGSGEHPTQALLDLFTIIQEHGTIDGLTIALVGDLRFGRTVHSLCYLFSNFNVKLILVSPDRLRMPAEVVDYLRTKKITFEETEKLETALQQAQVLYSTRVQKERFDDLKEYEKFKHYYVLTRALIEKYNPKLTIMHPLPRIGEINEDVDGLPGAAYFRQVQNGVAVRMALLSLILGVE